jgi:hypothetical protein
LFVLKFELTYAEYQHIVSKKDKHLPV